jgi:large subunit ribosomal protein L24
MQKVKKGDVVLITKGKDRGKTGKVLKVFPKESKVIVEGLNLVKKHKKPKRAGEKGEIILIPRKISWSNVKVICPNCKKPTRVGFIKEGEDKYRFCKKCKNKIL